MRIVPALDVKFSTAPTRGGAITRRLWRLLVLPVNLVAFFVILVWWGLVRGEDIEVRLP